MDNCGDGGIGTLGQHLRLCIDSRGAFTSRLRPRSGRAVDRRQSELSELASLESVSQTLR